MGLRPLQILNSPSAGTDFVRQILTSKEVSSKARARNCYQFEKRKYCNQMNQVPNYLTKYTSVLNLKSIVGL